ncbi:P-loop containing nucleoside triphosphate hydrolase protein [Ilyonectria robusta]|uniref:P-loop containing nucleoside triphosphate hydrolase protein n=1 Tax=Ilyonectria robusta TaxID=1079257 RepID=UPI001E8E14C0|nr:P-loop containing nucleoside triphosphate hydrolase protein [Ilyonectria robusta]KAH8672945.1 P-loop containing nucleoside triphosphate hydrolase protein [Ilyonectria robusta]
MEDQVKKLVEKAWRRYQETPQDRRLLIGVAGIPGSGKTTLSQIITSRLNAHAASTSPPTAPPATFVPMDGFHLTRAALSAMPDPAVAHARRGAAFTFDAPKFLALVSALRAAPIPEAPVLAPSFDHAVKDPKDDDIAVLPQHRIVVLEGNYVALDGDVWRDAAALLDELWFVEVDYEVARRRLRERHVRAGIVKDIEEGDRRAVENDLPNGDEILKNRLKIDEVVYSREDGGWVHE